MPVAWARCPIESPSMPSTVARRAAASGWRRGFARRRSVSRSRGGRVVSTVTLDKLARPVELSPLRTNGRTTEGPWPGPARHPAATRRPARSSRPLGRRPSPQGRAGLGRHRRLSGRARPARRAGALGRRLAGRQLGVRAGPPADRPALRRPGQLCASVVVSAPRATLRARCSARRYAEWRRCCGATRRSARAYAPGRRSVAEGRRGVVRGGAAAGTAEMVRAASRLRAPVAGGGGPGNRGVAHGLGRACGRSSTSENKAAMLRSESCRGRSRWPCSLSPSARSRRPGSRCCSPSSGSSPPPARSGSARQLTGITIWAMNFALMFALAVGIDYALFVVVRFRAALRAGLARSTRSPRRWTAPARRWSSAAWPCSPRCPRSSRAEPAVPDERARHPARRRLRARRLADAAAGAAGAASVRASTASPCPGRAPCSTAARRLPAGDG